jgi:hypothetical protein
MADRLARFGFRARSGLDRSREGGLQLIRPGMPPAASRPDLSWARNALPQERLTLVRLNPSRSDCGSASASG